MCDETVKALRVCEEGQHCDLCPKWTDKQNGGMNVCQTALLKEAADAIEELQQIAGHYEESAHDYFKDVCYYLERVPKWIPVTERLPVGGDDSGAICENVCLLMDDGTVTCGWMNGITKKVYYLNARDDFIIKAPITRVTHWMPLPKPPKEGET